MFSQEIYRNVIDVFCLLLSQVTKKNRQIEIRVFTKKILLNEFNNQFRN